MMRYPPAHLTMYLYTPHIVLFLNMKLLTYLIILLSIHPPIRPTTEYQFPSLKGGLVWLIRLPHPYLLLYKGSKLYPFSWLSRGPFLPLLLFSSPLSVSHISNIFASFFVSLLSFYCTTTTRPDQLPDYQLSSTILTRDAQLPVWYIQKT